MGVVEPDIPVHAKHYKDGFPLCWKENQKGLFEASYNEGEVTCPDCIDYLKEVP